MQRPNDDAKKLIKKAQDEIHAGHFQKAEKLARQAVVADGNNADAHALLGFALYERNDPACVNQLDRAIELSPNNLTARFVRAGWYRKQKDQEKFKSEVAYVIEKGPMANEYSFQRELAEIAFIWLADDAYQREEFQLAYAYYQNARSINPLNRNAMLGIARSILYNVESREGVVDWLKTTATLFPDDLKVLRDYAIALLKQGQINKAKRYFEELSWFISNDELKIYDAVILAHQGDAKKAFNSVHSVCARVQKDEDYLLLSLAELALAAKEPDRVLPLLANYSGSNPSAKLFKACALMQKNQIAACREELQALWQENLSFITKMDLITVEGRLVSSQEEREALRRKFTAAMQGREFRENPKLVSVALAAFACGEIQTAKMYLAPFLEEYYPQAIALVLQADFLKMISTLPALSKDDLAALKVHDRRVFKSQLLQMMWVNLTDKASLNVCLRALCRGSLLGSIFHLQRNHAKPSILKGALKAIAKALNTLVVGEDILGIEPVTIRLLRDEIRVSRSFAKNLEAEYPNLYAWMKKISLEMFPPKNQDLRVTSFFHAEDLKDCQTDRMYQL